MAIEEVCSDIIGWEQDANGQQEFSIEIPDKEADAIHSGMLNWLYPYW